MQVRHVMTARVHTLKPEHKVFAAGEIMHWAHVRHVPVVDARGTLVGVLSDRDVLRASMSTVGTHVADADRRQHLTRVTVSEVMTPPAHVATPEMTVRQAAATMRTFHVDCLPVVDHGRLVGIVTAFDLLGLVVHLSDDGLSAAASAARHAAEPVAV
jgi:CBS domain-containing protein